MSRENRMLVMFAVGVMLLFTYFRVQYPNMGEIEELRPAQEAPLLQVVCDPELRATLEKIVRSYELEFGVRIVLDSEEQASEKLSQADLFIALGDDQGVRGVPLAENVVHWFDHQLPEDDTRGGSVHIGLVDHDESRRKGSARLARYILARDRGLPILTGEADDQADLWSVDPEVSLVIWQGLYSHYQAKLEEFQRMEGVAVRVVVADCSLLASKVADPVGVDAIVYPNLNCLGESELVGWEQTAGGELELVLVGQRGDGRRETLIPPETQRVSLVSPVGFSELLSDQALRHITGRKLSQAVTEYSRLTALLGEIRSNPDTLGIMFKTLEPEDVEDLQTQEVLDPMGSVGMTLYSSTESTSKQLIGRLGRFLGWE